MNKYLEEFRSEKAARIISDQINALQGNTRLTIMEICGGHTLTTMKYGLHTLLPETLTLKSGPGCPVCVTSTEYIDTAIALLQEHDVIIASFGDMLRVPGSTSTLLKQRSLGRDVRICFSPMDALSIAKENPGRKTVFLAIGFETTAPGIAVAIREAEQQGIGNIAFLTALKTMPQAMKALLSDPEALIDGFILPGHVTAVMGTGMYDPVIETYPIPGVVSGFEPTDMLASIRTLVEMIIAKKQEIVVQYTRAVKKEGNTAAQKIMNEVFVTADVSWRGLGTIPGSGLSIAGKYSHLDAEKKYAVSLPQQKEHPGCICGDVMKGKKTPNQCSLFKQQCTPENPVGACMVSAEGSCGIYFNFGRIHGR
ncbi:MAG: hydrogenase formation protein HypD [Spirochaetales bacterium]|nr:hydrogenase formation protein HypD [Spirochaetales bacterium]